MDLEYPSCVSSIVQTTEMRKNLSINSLLNPAPLLSFEDVSLIPRYSTSDIGNLHLVDTFHKRERRTAARSKLFRQSPYPPAHERFRQNRHSISARFPYGENADSGNIDPTATREQRHCTNPPKRGRITLDAFLDGVDQERKAHIELERQARQSRVEWLKYEASRMEVPRLIQHSPLETRALAKWLADILCYSLLGEQTESSGELAKELRRDLRALLRSCINPFTSMLFLSLFYIRKLFPSGLRIIHGYPVHDQAKIVFRAFCIALLLAFKWLDDFEPRIGDRPPIVEDDHWREKRKDPTKYRSCWSDFMTMSIAEVQAVEVSALVVLDWNISISTPDWYFWLDELHDYTVVEPESTSYATVAQLIVAAQEELDQTCPDASFMSSLSLEGSRARSPEPLSRLARALLVGINPPFESPFPVTPEYALEVETGWASSSRRELCCSSEIDGGQWATPTELRHSSEGWASPVCFTAELRCSEDEIVRGPTRVIGYAPGPSPYTLTLSDSEHSRDSDSSIDFLHHEDIRARIPHAGVQRDDSPLYDDSQPLTPVFLDPWNCYTATGLYL